MDMEKGLVFQSALDYWTPALSEVFNVKEKVEDEGNIKFRAGGGQKSIIINEWPIDFAVFGEHGCPDLESNQLKPIEHYSPEDYLYIYVAPITWASRYKNNGFRIVGPSFGTNDSLRVYAGTYDYNHQDEEEDKQVIKVGTIGKYITSTALFQIYHLFMEYIFSTNIHLRSSSLDMVEKMALTANFQFEDIGSRGKRSRLLESCDRQSCIDYAVFTYYDICKLELESNDEIREILKIDPVLMHIFNISYVPRSVYCIHESQIKSRYALQLEHFNDLLTQCKKHLIKDGKSGDVPNKKLTIPFTIDGNHFETEVYPLSPYNDSARKVQKLIIQHYKIILEKDSNVSEDTEKLFEDIEWYDLYGH